MFYNEQIDTIVKISNHDNTLSKTEPKHWQLVSRLSGNRIINIRPAYPPIWKGAVNQASRTSVGKLSHPIPARSGQERFEAVRAGSKRLQPDE